MLLLLLILCVLSVFIVMWETERYSTSEGSQLEVCLIRGDPFGPDLVTPALFNVNTASLEAQGMTPPPPPPLSPSLPIPPSFLSSPSHLILPLPSYLCQITH